MSSIKLNTTSGGSVSIVPQDTVSDVVFTIPATTATIVTSDVLAASSGSSLVGYLPSGTGAVTTTVQSKLRESVSVKDFGAVGDGVADDTAAIQAAINGIPTSLGGTDPGYTLYFPRGKYKISSTIIIGNRRITFFAPSIMGSGSAAIIQQTSNNITWFDFTTGNSDVIAIDGLEFLGTGTGTGTVFNLGRTTQPCYDSRITNCWFSSIGGPCLTGTNLQGCHITNNAFDVSITHGIKLLVGINNIIANNRFYGVTTAGVEIAQGSNNVISNNLFDYSGSANDTTGAIVISYAGTDTRSNLISGNMFRANYNDIVLNGQGGVYSSNTGVNDTVITGNTSDRNNRHFVYATDANQIRITANALCAPGRTGGMNAIEILGTCDGTYISANSVTTYGALLPVYGFNLGATSTNTVIGGNKFVGSSGAYNVTAGATLAYENAQAGTWVPSVGGTATYTIQEGFYTKVGRMVFVKAKLIINVIGTGSTSIISGLPFVSDNQANGSQGSGTVSYFSGLATSVVSLTAIAVNNSSNIQFSGLTAAAATMTPVVAMFASGTRVDFSIVYTTTA